MQRGKLFFLLLVGLLIGGLFAGASPASAMRLESVSTADTDYQTVFFELCADDNCNPLGDFFIWQTDEGADPETVLYLDEDDICGEIHIPDGTYYAYFQNFEVTLGYVDGGIKSLQKCTVIMSTHELNDYVTANSNVYQEADLENTVPAYDEFISYWTVPEIADIVPVDDVCFDEMVMGAGVLSTWSGDKLYSYQNSKLTNICGHTIMWITNYD